MKITATLRNNQHEHELIVGTNGEIKELQIPQSASGYGSLVNGAELLLAALATCYCNDIYREARKRNIVVTGVQLEFRGEFGAEGEPGRNFHYAPTVVSDAPKEEIDALITYTDSIAEIHNTLRRGLSITLKR